MNAGHTLNKYLDTVSQYTGQALSWLTLIMVVLTATIVSMRSFIGWGSIALQESVSYLHATVLMLCLGYNLQQNAHVRVDVFYGRLGPVGKAWIDAIGSIVFLLPFAIFLIVVSVPFVKEAWVIKETSADPGGLPFVYLLKTLIPVSALLLALQAVSEAIRALLTLTFHPPLQRDSQRIS